MAPWDTMEEGMAAWETMEEGNGNKPHTFTPPSKKKPQTHVLQVGPNLPSRKPIPGILPVTQHGNFKVAEKRPKAKQGRRNKTMNVRYTEGTRRPEEATQQTPATKKRKAGQKRP